MAYDDYAEQPELSPTEMATQMMGQAGRAPEGIFKSAIGISLTAQMTRQAFSLGMSIPKGRPKYSGLPSLMGLRTLVGRKLTAGAGLRGIGAGAILGSIMGANPLAGAAIGAGVALLPKLVGKMTGNPVTRTGARGMAQAIGRTGYGYGIFDKISNGFTFGRATNYTADYLPKSMPMKLGAPPRVDPKATLSLMEGIDRWKNAERGLVLYDPKAAARSAYAGGFQPFTRASTFKGTEDLYRMMTRSPAQFKQYLAEISQTSKVGAATLGRELLQDVTRNNITNDIYQMFTGRSRSAMLLNKQIAGVQMYLGVGTAGTEGLMSGGFLATQSPKASRMAAAGRLGIRGAGVAAAAGIAYLGGSFIASQVSRGAVALRDNLRNMNTALRLTEFGGRGSFMNDVVNTERDRAISAMQFLRSGRDFIGLEARLLAGGFNG